MSKREVYEKNMEENLALWGARLETIKAKLNNETPAEGKDADRKKIEDWQARSAAVTALLEVLKTTHSDQWDVLKLELAKAWHDLDSLMETAEQEMRTFDDEAKGSASAAAAASIPVAVAAVSTPPASISTKPA